MSYSETIETTALMGDIARCHVCQHICGNCKHQLMSTPGNYEQPYYIDTNFEQEFREYLDEQKRGLWQLSTTETSQDLESSLADPNLGFGSNEQALLLASPQLTGPEPCSQHSQRVEDYELFDTNQVQCLEWPATTALVRAVETFAWNEHCSLDFPATPPLSTMELYSPNRLEQTRDRSADSPAQTILPPGQPSWPSSPWENPTPDTSPTRRRRHDDIDLQVRAEVEKLGLKDKNKQLVYGRLQGKTYADLARERGNITSSGLSMRMKRLRNKHPLIQEILPIRNRSPAKPLSEVGDTIHVRLDNEISRR